MLGKENKKYNNPMNIKQQQPYQEIEELEGITSTPKQKYYQNAYITLNNNNITSIKKSNNPGNLNSNIKMMNIKGNISSIGKINNNNNLNGNKNITNNLVNNNLPNNNINRALMVIRNEFKKKDDQIKSLELKVAELEKKINIITNSNISNQQNNDKLLNNINMPITKNFTFGDKLSNEINANNENKKIEIGVGSYRIDNEKIKDNSVITGNSSNSKVHSKNEVKLYLKEVKEKVEPSIFKEFISYIKLLTSSKDNNGVDRNEIVENVRELFGEQYKNLFIKFQSIIGVY